MYNVEGPSNSVEQDHFKLCKQTKVTNTYHKHFNIFSQTEDMKYKKCVGDAMRRCFINMETSFENQKDKAANPSFYYVECYENEENICRAPMLRMFIKYGKVLKKMRDALE